MRILTAAALVAALLLPTGQSAGAKDVIPQAFSPPVVHNMQVDYCLTFGKNCGQPAADKFCQKQGFQYAAKFSKDNSPALPTLVLGSGAWCKTPGQCASFTSVTCGGKPGNGNLGNDEGMNPIGDDGGSGNQPLKPGDKIEGDMVVHDYKKPQWKGAPLDRCKFFGQDCGKPAADAFCQAKGFAYSTKVLGADYAQVTRVVGDNKVCTDNTCRALSYVKCARAKNG